MSNARKRLHPRARLGWALVITALSMTGLMAADSCGGGGGSCQACLEDCARNGIPAGQCNCEGCTQP